ncbi:ATPase-like protein [Planktothrix tepida]|uniref:ATPase-like protein n=2 Tax=Planktothrix TaxID=54304 RepID=A0A1J1LV33_9CYAN|nr:MULTISPECIES: AAA family ATPase [Planktothrix]CAD5919114.1 ATPase-like protein [Planktothrix pseudagardhii]CAD5981951.1 ATPase-like protein [Planktothrix tepida]CUR35724.1 ATPase-like protein [Planktothrix tepida PCC 9214]
MVLNLKSANIKNYKSLGNVSLTFRDLTIIVGANSTGKSNIIGALELLSIMVYNGSPPPPEFIKKRFRVMNDELIYKIKIEDENTKADYELSISANSETEKPSFSREKLKVDKIEVIDIVKGEGNVQDEDGKAPVSYNSKSGNLALNTAGDFGYKPFTSEVSEFIKHWEFYNLDPEIIGRKGITVRQIQASSSLVSETPKLDQKGGEVQEILLYWAEKNKNKFQEINQKLQDMVNMEFEVESDSDGDKFIQVLEGDGVQVPLSSMADGTLRLIAYLILLIDDELPPLIGIEEPERSFHPGLLSDIASIIKQLSQKTQVVITTHSSQLLDCFTVDEINSDVSLILLTKKDNKGTVAYPIDELSQKRESFLDWMQEFGVGSAIFHSQLLYDIQKQ